MLIEARSPQGSLQYRYNVAQNGRFEKERIEQTLSAQTRGVLRAALNWFLPSGFPHSVTSDYTAYQVFDSLQAFSSSIAGLISSRALLQSIGVGDANSTPTAALLLNIAQETAGRLATINFAHQLGTSLSPDCKYWRLYADLLNDTALLLDMFSPFLRPVSPALHATVLCISAAFRATCGVTAGGAKAALSVHFAKTGNIGDLNAKDSSQETVIGLMGMLAGSFIVPRLTTPLPTFLLLFFLIGVHIFTNYCAVRSVVQHSLNRQRASIVFSHYLSSNGQVLTPHKVSRMEIILSRGQEIVTKENGSSRIFIGVSVSKLLQLRTLAEKGEKDVSIIETPGYFIGVSQLGKTRVLSICLKYSRDGQVYSALKAWCHAVWLATLHPCVYERTGLDFEKEVDFDQMLKALRNAEWNLDEDALVYQSETRWSTSSAYADDKKEA